MKKILITATELHMTKFWLPHIKHLTECGYKVDLVCSKVSNKWEILEDEVKKYDGMSLKEVDLKRSPASLHNIKGFFQMKKYVNDGKYDVVITNEPVMGMITRFACASARRKGTKVIYIAHGFHFWKGAPKKNWAIFYTVEKLAAHFTDVLVTMNSEDFNRAKEKMKAKKVKFIHGIGVDLNKFKSDPEIRIKKRAELGLKENDFMLFSASELIPRKNLKVAIDAVKILDNPSVKLFIRGEGELMEELKAYVRDSGVSDKVFLMGFGRDINEMNLASDACIFPTLQEGLPVALLESMACLLPVVCSDVRGNCDLIKNGKGGYLCDKNSPADFAEKITLLMNNKDK
ncbi:MAG: glycosyltransferase, partial [Acutalibacteraceae bacterium]